MFNNANVIFRTKFVDGVSTVTRTMGVGASRKQLTQSNRNYFGSENDKEISHKNKKRGKENSQT